jgi:amidase
MQGHEQPRWPAFMNTQTITDLDAHALSQAIHARTLSCREVMQSYLARIDRLNPGLNAIVNRVPAEALLRQADEHDSELARGASRGWMHGMPQAIKDTGNALGLPTTFGSPLLANAVATQDSLYVARMKAAGCIVIGKTNVPEFAMGSHTYNPVFGSTPNAWDRSVTAGGSSGGACVALAQRLLPVADGSDFMGSLRNPACWNHVFGLRPSQGRVPAWPRPDLWVAQLGVDGPLGRSVRDLAALLNVQAGHDARAPLSIAQSGIDFIPAADASASALKGLRVGWLGDLGGHLAVQDGILDVCSAALTRMAGAGAQVEPTSLGFSETALWDAWLVWRRALTSQGVAAVLSSPDKRAQIKPEALWEYDTAQGLDFATFMKASALRSAYYQHMVTMFERFDVLALPVAQVWPFKVDITWPRSVAGRPMDTYHRWMECTLYATFAGLPAISVPAGFDASGRWPMGVQLIGRPQGDGELLRVAAGYEALIPELLSRRPAEPA